MLSFPMSRNSSCADCVRICGYQLCCNKTFSRVCVRLLGSQRGKFPAEWCIATIASCAARSVMRRMVMLLLVCGVGACVCVCVWAQFSNWSMTIFVQIKTKWLHWVHVSSSLSLERNNNVGARIRPWLCVYIVQAVRQMCVHLYIFLAFVTRQVLD